MASEVLGVQAGCRCYAPGHVGVNRFGRAAPTSTGQEDARKGISPTPGAGCGSVASPGGMGPPEVNSPSLQARVPLMCRSLLCDLAQNDAAAVMAEVVVECVGGELCSCSCKLEGEY